MLLELLGINKLRKDDGQKHARDDRYISDHAQSNYLLNLIIQLMNSNLILVYKYCTILSIAHLFYVNNNLFFV